MYDIAVPEEIRLVGQIFLGGLIHKETEVKVTQDEELTVGGWHGGLIR